MVTAYFHLLYLGIGIQLTLWVGKNLAAHGRAFLDEGFPGNRELASGVNQLLNVGFYLVNMGWVCLLLSSGEKPANFEAGLEALSTKIGIVLLILGGMHFFNVYVLNRFRTRALTTTYAPPVAPDGRVAVRRA